MQFYLKKTIIKPGIDDEDCGIFICKANTRHSSKKHVVDVINNWNHSYNGVNIKFELIPHRCINRILSFLALDKRGHAPWPKEWL